MLRKLCRLPYKEQTISNEYIQGVWQWYIQAQHRSENFQQNIKTIWVGGLGCHSIETVEWASVVGKFVLNFYSPLQIFIISQKKFLMIISKLKLHFISNN